MFQFYPRFLVVVDDDLGVGIGIGDAWSWQQRTSLVPWGGAMREDEGRLDHSSLIFGFLYMYM